MEVEGARPRGRQSEIWLEVVMKELGLASVDALDYHSWKRKNVGDTC